MKYNLMVKIMKRRIIDIMAPQKVIPYFTSTAFNPNPLISRYWAE